MVTAWTTQAYVAAGAPGCGSFMAGQHIDWATRNIILAVDSATATDAADLETRNRLRSNVPHCPWPTYEDVVDWANSEGVNAALGRDETQNSKGLQMALLAAIDDVSEDTGLEYFVTDADGVMVDPQTVAEVPARVHLATVMHAHKLYLRRKSPDGTLGASAFGGAVRVSRYDPDVRALLKNYLRRGVA